jgi:hypothetical protein
VTGKALLKSLCVIKKSLETLKEKFDVKPLRQLAAHKSKPLVIHLLRNFLLKTTRIIFYWRAPLLGVMLKKTKKIKTFNVCYKFEHTRKFTPVMTLKLEAKIVDANSYDNLYQQCLDLNIRVLVAMTSIEC